MSGLTFLDPTAFTQWFLNDASADVSVLKTELNLEPIRTDAVTLVQTQHCILHLEVQVAPEPTLPDAGLLAEALSHLPMSGLAQEEKN
ncbi:hypothetical protein [Parathermosynechococcus lividus]